MSGRSPTRGLPLRRLPRLPGRHRRRVTTSHGLIPARAIDDRLRTDKAEPRRPRLPDLEVVRLIPRVIGTGLLPAIVVGADMLEAECRVGQRRDPDLGQAVAERPVLAQVVESALLLGD